MKSVIFKGFLSLSCLIFSMDQMKAQTIKGTISGTVTASEKPVPFANVGIKGTSWGATTDVEGVFKILNIPAGTYEVKVSYIGFEPFTMKAVVDKDEPNIFLEVVLKPVLKTLDEFVVTGTRYEKRKLDSAIPVNILDKKTLESTQSLTLSEGLVYQPGIRIEKDCQTCNYSQVRMNGMPGSYTQILLNSRPLFSSLAGLYGLEQIPASMIERVEVVKGGGSVLYGSSAIAGTINIITRDPEHNDIELSTTGSLINGESGDIQSDLFTSLVNKNKKTGASLIISGRNREPWDANNDGFSEMAQLKNLSIALNAFYKVSPSGKLKVGINNINEIRNGGDQLNEEPHLRLQSEYRKSNITAGSFDYSHLFFHQRTDVSFFGGYQQTIREHYTGSFGADGYGNSDNKTFIGGMQVNHTLLNFISGKNILTGGFEYQFDDVLDQIEAYNYLIDQKTYQTSVFLQSDWDIIPKINLVTGVRISNHNKVDDLILSPRISLLYKMNQEIQFRASRSTGFRAPQAFDADMHIAFSGGGITLTEIDPDLQSEHSVSYSFSADYNLARQKYIYGFTLAAFYNSLKNTFILIEDALNGNADQTILTRTNGSQATVKGVTIEARLNYNYIIEGDIGLTIQKSYYDEVVNWSADVEGTSHFLRTPSAYGYFTLSGKITPKIKMSFSGVYTGTMDVPHFAGAPGVDNDEVIQTTGFVELNLKVDKDIQTFRNTMKINISFGVQNLFNAFQDDFDSGPNRDSNYIYGPGRPRTWFVGLKLVPTHN